MSAWDLPVTVDVNGQPFVVRSDFRAVLDALAALSDQELTQAEQLSVCLQILYPDWEQLPDAQAAFTAAMVFVNCGEPLPEHQLPKPRLVDWEKDAGLIAPAIDKILGYSCRRSLSPLVGVHWGFPRYRARPVFRGGEYPRQTSQGKTAGKARTGICPRE